MRLLLGLLSNFPSHGEGVLHNWACWPHLQASISTKMCFLAWGVCGESPMGFFLGLALSSALGVFAAGQDITGVGSKYRWSHPARPWNIQLLVKIF